MVRIPVTVLSAGIAEESTDFAFLAALFSEM